MEEIRQANLASPEAEICGLLLGKGREVQAIRPCANVAADPSDSFEIDPAALIAVHRAARTGGPALIGHYHSHPGGKAAPSARDAAAAQPGFYWIIAAGEAIECWLAAPGGRFVPITMVEPGIS